MPLLKSISCTFDGHMAPEEDIIKLLNQRTGFIETTCCRCENPITIKLDPENPKKYILSER